MPEINDDALGRLVWCAMSYDRRTPRGDVPIEVWELLNSDWREKINRWKGASTDHLGAEVRKPPR